MTDNKSKVSLSFLLMPRDAHARSSELTPWGATGLKLGEECEPSIKRGESAAHPPLKGLEGLEVLLITVIFAH